MKKAFISSFLAACLAAAACSNAPQNTAPQQAQNTGSINNQGAGPSDSLIVSSHSTNKSETAATPAGAAQKGQNNQTEGPMAKPIDASALTAGIEKAEKNYKAKPNDAKAKEQLAEAYFERAFALTEAAQYRAALGDFRKGLKLKPEDAEAKSMHDRILRIFADLNRQPPKEGEEPPPLPFKKAS